MIVELGSGYKGLYINDLILYGDMYESLNNYNDDLTHCTGLLEEEIIRVYKKVDYYNLDCNSYDFIPLIIGTNTELIWERSKEKAVVIDCATKTMDDEEEVKQ